ncbi:hypothetical protein [Enterocloster lavalensis]|uniref:hypothetical protein n=1 Tax=Enterocloster lavalensis TaxID=460384 RepID=UPI0011B1FE4C|nr:hypothetical protein [Enterocloster lavalensis]
MEETGRVTGVDVAREAAAGAEMPRSGGDTTVRQGDHGPAETPRFGGDATVRRRYHGPAETPRFGGDTTVRRGDGG